MIKYEFNKLRDFFVLKTIFSMLITWFIQPLVCGCYLPRAQGQFYKNLRAWINYYIHRVDRGFIRVKSSVSFAKPAIWRGTGTSWPHDQISRARIRSIALSTGIWPGPLDPDPMIRSTHRGPHTWFNPHHSISHQRSTFNTRRGMKRFNRICSSSIRRPCPTRIPIDPSPVAPLYIHGGPWPAEARFAFKCSDFQINKRYTMLGLQRTNGRPYSSDLVAKGPRHDELRIATNRRLRWAILGTPSTPVTKV
jgi:hypothetical protein